jgi:hypothetical protein
MEEAKKVPAEIVEELKTLALLHEPCTLQFRAVNGGVSTVTTKLTDVFEDEDGQYLLASNGLTLQLHQLLAINGKPLEHFC